MKQLIEKKESPALLHEQALIELRSGRLKKGVDLLHKALEANPASGDLHNDMATALWQMGQNDQAQAHFNKAIKLESKRPHIFNNYGYFLLTTGQAKTAERLLRKAIELKPDFGEAMNNLGLCLHTLGKRKEAEYAYITAIRLNPSWPETHYNIGRFYLQTGIIARAEAALQKTTELAPKHYRAWFELAQVRQAQNRIDECLECLKKSRDINPAFEQAWLQSIMILNQQGETEKAESLADDALKVTPGSPSILVDRAASLRLRQQYQAALNTLDRIKEQAQSWPPVLFERARNHQGLLQPDQAFAAFAAANAACKPQAADMKAVLEIIRDNRNLFKHKWIKSWTPAPPQTLGINPVFVVRFPGSAYIALPPALFDKPDVEVTHGVPAITNVVNYLKDILGNNYPEDIKSLTGEQITQARLIYMASLQAAKIALKPGSTIIDTSPVNIIYAGLIHRLFPDSPFIVAQMHPYDEVLLSFMEQPAPREATIRTFDLTEAAKLYGQSYRLWEDYRIMLPFNVAERDKPPAQNLWKAYQPHLGKMIPILDPWAEKYGYPTK